MECCQAQSAIIMVFEKPPSGRARVRDNGYTLEIIIPARKNLFVIIFLMAWMGGWLMGEIFALSELVSIIFKPPDEGLPAGIDLFLLFWLIGWTIGGIAVFGFLAWMIIGREIITLTPEALSIGKRLFKIKRRKHYLLPDVKNLRLLPSYDTGFFNFSVLWQQPRLAFDFGMKTVKFAASIDEAEASSLLAMFDKRGLR